MNISIVLPCYNESKNLLNILNSIILMKQKYFKINLNFILVENGSCDNSKDILEKFNKENPNKVLIVYLDKNLGYGEGIMKGVLHSKTDIICWTHADLQFDLQDVIEIIINNYKDLIKNKIIIKGKRYGRNLLDNFFTNMMSYIASIFYLKKYISDINAQPKIFHNQLLSSLINYPKDFLIDLFLIKKALENDYIVIENVIKMNDRIHGESKGGGSFSGKLKLSFKTLSFIFRN